MFQRAAAFLLLAALVILACLSAGRRLERERRLIARLRAREALSADRAIPVSGLSADEQDTLQELMATGIVRTHGPSGRRHGSGNRARQSCYLDRTALAGLRHRRTRLALSGVLALALAVLLIVVALHR